MEEIYLILGCHGYQEEGFVSCGALENVILIITSNLVGYDKLLDYLDGVNLFDKPILDYNSIKHIIRNIYDSFDQYDKKIWSEKTYSVFQKFLANHKPCGLYLKLSTDKIQTQIQEKEINIIIKKRG